MSEQINKALVAYVVDQPLGANQPGDVIQLDAEKAAALVEAGYIHEATEDEVNGGEEEMAEEAPAYVENAARNLETKVTAAVEATAAKVAEKLKAAAPAPSIPKITVRDQVDPTWGFKSIGEFAYCLRKKEVGDFDGQQRWNKMNTMLKTKGYMGTGGGPTVTSTDGGNIIPPAYAASLFDKLKSVTKLTEFCFDEPFTGNTLEVPVVNESGPANGVTAYWTSEGSSITDSKPTLSTVEIKLNPLTVLVNASDYVLEDNAYALDSFIQQYVPKKMIFELNKHVLYGTGNGVNVIGNAATVAVTRNTSSHIYFADIIAMYSRMSEWNLDEAKWFISPSTLPELFNLSFPSSSGTYPIFVPTGVPGGYPSAQYQPVGMLYGKEVVLCSNMQPLGNKGDILFADLSQVSKIEKQLDGKMTPFLYFDKALSTFRFILRIGTGSRWLQPWTRPDTVTASPYVVLTGNSTVPN